MSTDPSAHAHHLKNLYIYFWRWATLKVFGSGWHDSTGETDVDRFGVVCFITVAGFLNGPGFQKMREDLRRDCSDIWVIDCSPEGHQPEVPTRIFQGVQQPVCIVLAARSANKNRDRSARLQFTSLPKGKRDKKFETLEMLSLESRAWSNGPNGWRDPFLPEFAAAWGSYPPLSSFFAWSGPGVKLHRIWPISPDGETLDRRWNKLISESDSAKKVALFSPDRDRDLTRDVIVDLGSHATRRTKVGQDREAVVPPTRYAFRSFDRQWIIPDHRLLSRARPQLWRNYSGRQTYLTALEAHSPVSGPAVTFTDLVPDQDHYKGSFGGRVYPLWTDSQSTQPNIRPELLTLLAEAYGRPVSAEDAMAYIAAVMAHPAFTQRFAADLKRPGLRLPLTADAVPFAEAVSLGREVIWLHCYGERFVDAQAGRPRGAPRMAREIEPFIPAEGEIPPAPEPLPEDMHYDAATRRLHVGKGFVEKVSPAMWEYGISGKQVLKQWFSYRRRDRSKPIIGDRRPPSPLEKIQPEGWLPEYTTDLLNLLRVLGRVIALEPAQATLLDRICDGLLIPPEDLRVAGLIETLATESESGEN